MTGMSPFLTLPPPVEEVGIYRSAGNERRTALGRPSGEAPTSMASQRQATHMTYPLVSSPTFADLVDRIRALMHGRRLLAWNAPFDRTAIRRTEDSRRTCTVAENDDRSWAMRARAYGWAIQAVERSTATTR